MTTAVKAGEKPYRRGVGIVLVNNRGHVFVGQRHDTRTAAWQMPQGGIDAGETPRMAALRELKEEVGTDHARIVAVTREWLTYDLPARLQKKVWGGKYRGQRQKWFLMRYLGTDADIDVATLNPEFSRWKWLPFSQLPRSIVGFKRELYKQVVAAFRDKIATLSVSAKKRSRREKKKTPAKRRRTSRGISGRGI